jgi:hypothetical protein
MLDSVVTEDINEQETKQCPKAKHFHCVWTESCAESFLLSSINYSYKHADNKSPIEWLRSCGKAPQQNEKTSRGVQVSACCDVLCPASIGLYCSFLLL